MTINFYNNYHYCNGQALLINATVYYIVFFCLTTSISTECKCMNKTVTINKRKKGLMFTDSVTKLFQANILSYISITMNSYVMCTISCATYPDRQLSQNYVDVTNFYILSFIPLFRGTIFLPHHKYQNFPT